MGKIDSKSPDRYIGNPIKMTCFDCKKFVPKKCKADCCGPVPIPNDVYERNMFHRIGEVDELFQGPGWVIPFPKGEDLKCVFLRPDFQCNIYEDRPDVCRQFGFVEELQCPYQTKEGVQR